MSRKYSDFHREQAVAAYVAEGSYAAASRITGIPESTIRLWRKESPTWWQTVENEQRELFEVEQRGYLAQIRSQSAEGILDRLKNGDEKIVQGKKVRVQVSAKEMAIIYGVATDKMRISLGQPISISGKGETAKDKLAELREAVRSTAVEEGKVTELKASA